MRERERGGSGIVEAMLSKSAPVFYGDLRSHERVIFFVYFFKTLWNFELLSLMEVNKPNYSFCTFIGYCKQRMQNRDFGYAEHAEDAPEQIYLSQVPTSWAFV